jgi:alpha-L-arabinofuranosidase
MEKILRNSLRRSSIVKPSIAGLTLLLLGAILFFTIRKMRWPLLTIVAGTPPPPAIAQGPTVIQVSQVVLHKDVKRLGINLGASDSYDSLQTLRNLVSRNPGFEGREWQTVIQCGQVTADSCTDATQSGSWPAGFLDGGTYEVISGAATGQTGAIVHSTAASGQASATIQFAPGGKALAVNDYIVVRKTTLGEADGGWGVQANGGATVTTEFKDLSSRTTGLQAIRITALRPDQNVYLKQYFDSTPGTSFVQLRGPYVIHFRAKCLGGNKSLGVYVQRGWSSPAALNFQQTVLLTGSWQDYTLNFNAAEPRNAVGTVAFGFSIGGSEVLLDDVSLEEASSNGTAFRNDVVATLQRLKPGVLRYMDSGQNWGSTLDNMLAPQQARQRSGYNKYSNDPADVPIGLHDFLVLSEKIGAEPWYSIQIGWSAEEAANLMEYLGGPVTTKYGAARAALGHPIPWTQTFPVIHLEFGNEAWNTAQPGASIGDAVVYANRATTIFGAMRSSKWYAPGHFNMVADGQAVNTYLNAKVLEVAQGIDSIDIAPYTFGSFNDDSSIEHIFGPMFTEPQMVDSASDGYVHRQANTAATAVHPAHLAVYEVNIGTVDGTASQASLDSTVPSIGAGVASIDHMLLMLRDLGITVQNTFQLGGGRYHFTNTAGKDNNESSPVWAIVLDMGGPTDRVRPSFLAQQLANQVIRPTMLGTSITGSDPTWDQPLSANDKIQLGRVHELQSFAFADTASTTMILLNLSRTTARSVSLAGQCAPQGKVTVQTLTSANITDTNELDDKVKTTSREQDGVVPGTVFSLPPFSMTALSSSNHGCVPVS